MKLLAFDTSTPICTVAICNNNNVLQTHHNKPMQHGKVLLPMIQSLLIEADLSLAQLDAIVYGAGPGSYTGLRIASSVCQALAYAADKSVIAISSLQALAQTVWSKQLQPQVLVLQDARMGQFYFAHYAEQNGRMESKLNDSLFDITQLDQYLNNQIVNTSTTFIGVGDGWAKVAELIATLNLANLNLDNNMMIDATALIELAKRQYAQRLLLTPAEAQPNYLR